MVKVSIIIPTYNYAQYILDAIDSVLQQDYPKDKIEIVVVDDGSTDSTKQVLGSLIESGTIKYFYQQNRGKASATYKAIQQSTGEYIFNLDADDYFLPGKIKHTVEVFEANPGVVHVANPAKQIQVDNSFRIEPIPAELTGHVLKGSMLLEKFISDNMLYGGGSTYAARASVLKQIIIPEAVDMYIDEFLVLAVLPYGNSFFIPEHLSVWRGHGANYSDNMVVKDTRVEKGGRLLKSSGAILQYLEENNYKKSLVKIYRLKHLTRQISFKEALQSKTLTDITKYAAEVFGRIRPTPQLIKNYHVMNRLLPMQMFTMLKKRFPKPPDKYYSNDGA